MPILARWLHGVALALWLGGLVTIGALVAPTAFHVTRSSPALASQPALQNLLAGGIVGGSLRLFNGVSLACGVLLLGTDAVLLAAARLGRSARTWTWAGMAVTVVLLAITAYVTWSLFPTMDAAQRVGDTVTFDRLHHRDVGLAGMQMVLLLLLALLAAGRDTLGAGRRAAPDDADQSAVLQSRQEQEAL